ncbi:MAG: small acid-soluble spore protein SspI [Bacilli bacterium]|nr:small acid-soluble spore protein SspI [Bacilli bacterium]
MEINIRNSIIDNFRNSSNEELHKTITDAIKLSEEKTLPGLGVFLELVWNNSSSEEKNHLINKLSTALKN